MQFEELLRVWRVAHEQQQTVLTPIQTIGFPLLNDDPCFIDRFAERVCTEPVL
jgi:hypothetical protein